LSVHGFPPPHPVGVKIPIRWAVVGDVEGRTAVARDGRGYHHGDLPAALLAAVDEIVRSEGVAGVSIREAARRAGVSNAAPRHHFGDKAGLLTAYATRGFERLAQRLEATEHGRDLLLHRGLAYVRFAVDEPGLFSVMFRPELLHPDDPVLAQAAHDAYQPLLEAVRQLRPDLAPDAPEHRDAAIGGWAQVHGFATLWLSGNLDAELVGVDPIDAAERALRQFVATHLQP
jgi:AcrR family transcriptional regulator